MRVSTVALSLVLALSIAFSFSFAQGTPPSPPTLLAPAAGATDVPTYITFSWNPSTGATSYDLQVSLSPLFETFAVNETGLTEHSFTPWKLFADGTSYYWRVRSVSPDGFSRWEPAVGGQAFATKHDSIAPPTLLLPADNATGVPPLVEFSWSPAEGAVAYQFQLATTPLFLQTLADIESYPNTVLTLPTPLPAGTVYFWRVRSIGPAGKSVWSPLLGGRSFTIGTGLLQSPALITPAKDAIDVPLIPTFTWSAVTGASEYQLLITDQPLVGTVLANVKGITATSFTPPVPLENSITYYWRVIATNASQNATSLPEIAGQAFTTVASGIPAPALISPADGSKDLSRQPEFKWNAVPGAMAYEILITSSQFLGGTEFRTGGITGTSIIPPPGALNAGVAYRWFVRAHGPAGNSPWAPGQTGWNFTTRLAPPSAPPLNIPVNGATGLPRAIVLSWWNNTDSTATSFRVQVATDAQFQQLVVDRSNVPGTELVVTLSLETKYYWRVLAVNSEGESPWSEVWTFNTGSVALLPPVLIYPKEDADHVPIRPTFTWEPAPGATAYDLQVWTPTGLPIWYQEKTVDVHSIDGTTFKPLAPLRRGTTYTWRVRSINSADTSLWSPMFTNRLFTTIPAAPPAPTVLSPEHESTGLPLAPTFCWQPVPEAQFYWLEIALDPGFRSIVASYCEVNGPCFTIPDNLSPNTTYFWRVSAKSDGGWGPHSSVLSFTTANLASELPVIVQQPANEHVQIGQTGTFGILAKGTGPLSYQWQKNDLDIPGANGPYYTTGSAKPAEDGSLYRCVVSNGQGSATSNAAILSISPTAVNVVENGDFESGTGSWTFYSNGIADFSNERPGSSSAHSGSITITAEGTNQQLYQSGIRLEPATYYRLRFNARADNGGVVFANLMRHSCPNTNYGLAEEAFFITPYWKPYSLEFPTSGFAGIVRDARLAFMLGSPHSQGDRFEFDDIVLEKIFTKDRYDTVVVNSGFENGAAPWEFVTSGVGTMKADVPGDGSANAALIHITTPGKNTQLYQADLMFVPDAIYQLTFRAYSSTGHDVSVYFHKHDSPFTSYGLFDRTFDLTTSWKTFSVRFVTPDITVPENSGRLRFWLTPFAEAGDDYFFDDIVLERIAPSAVADSGSILANPGFESGTAPWWFHTDGTGWLADDAAGDGSEHAACVRIDGEGSNVQLSQSAIVLKPQTAYRLTFKAYSNTGHNAGVALHKEASPYSNYGLEAWDIDLTTEWKTFAYSFITSGFLTPVGDARLRFDLGAYAKAGDRYYFDDIVLEQVGSGTPGAAKKDELDPSQGGGIPSTFIVSKNYPNPFNPSTMITFGVPEPSEVSLKVYNLVGQEIATIFEGSAAAGYHRVQWNALSRSGPLSSGVYFYRFTGRAASGKVHTQIEKMILLR